ncbi:MAG: hypothetical protein BWK76_12135 [Desulfobulbaceae bacterium A2]|nr:MAG: hypothetical protein BWK76_12135 [Desulfobulbaceae bacterium A2]
MIEFWAKTTPDGRPGVSVQDHMLIVGQVARCLAEETPWLLNWLQLRANEVGLLAAMHDLGKISPGFQRKCVTWLTENGLLEIARKYCWDTAMESDHGQVSHAAIQSFLPEIGFDNNSAANVAAVLGSHHGRLQLPNPRGFRPQQPMADSASAIDWHAARMSAARTLWKHFDCSGAAPVLSKTNPALWWLAGLTSVADWIGSDERFFPAKEWECSTLTAFSVNSAVQTIGFVTPRLRANLSFPEIFGFPPNEMQTQALTTITGPGVYVIEAPMGMGKTEAALGAAYSLMAAGKARGIYFALPTQATSNRIHLRMNVFLRQIAPESGESRLVHGNSWLMRQDWEINPTGNDFGEPGEGARSGRDWFASSKRALLAPFGVGTVDQALLGVVAAKHFFVRHFALAGKVVILDEIHAYDLYTGTLIDKLISTLEGLACTVIVLSATLTSQRRAQIVSAAGTPEEKSDAVLPYPLISGRRETVCFAPVAARPPDAKPVQVLFSPECEAADKAMQLAAQGGAVLWICNTVGEAQRQYATFAGMVADGVHLGLLHSRFPFHRREALEAEWMERLGKNSATRCGSILVATQVVEQSVDLDADLLVTELAPTDMLLQRLGRLWRHTREKRPVAEARMVIIEEAQGLDALRNLEADEIKKILGSKARVYAPFVLLRSLEVWKGHAVLSIPAQIRSLIEATYQERENEPESWLRLADEWFGTDSARRMLAQRNANLWQGALEDKEGLQTRLNEMPTVDLVLCRALSGAEAVFLDHVTVKLDREQQRLAVAQAIHRNLVRVPRQYFDRPEAYPAFDDYLHGEHCAGVVADDGTIQITGRLRSGVRLRYSEALGLVVEKIQMKEGV